MSTLRLLGLILLLPASGPYYVFHGRVARIRPTCPFIAPTIMLAGALDAIVRHFFPVPCLAFGASTLVLLSTGVQAQHVARAVGARDEIDHSLLGWISRLSSLDTIHVGSPDGHRAPWRLGARIGRARAAYADGRSSHQPLIKEVACGELHDHDRKVCGNLLLMSYAQVCGSIEHPTAALIQRFSNLDPTALFVRPDSFGVDLLGPLHAQYDRKSARARALLPARVE